MNKVVINNCYGGFSLSPTAVARLGEAGLKASEYHPGCERHDPLLIKIVEELGELAAGQFSELIIEEITEDRYIIREYDGLESITTPSMIRWTKVGGE